jgi:hypothetical protein
MPAIKPTSVKSDAQREDAAAEYKAEREEVLERMASQKSLRLSATEAVRRKNMGS